jgi:hypothetical protein
MIMKNIVAKSGSKWALKVAAIAGLGLGLSGCVYDSSVGLGYASDGYSSGYDCDPYSPFNNYYDCDNGYGFSNIGYRGGWYNNYYYPGHGFYLFDTYGRRYDMYDDHRRYWGQQRYNWYRGNRNSYRHGGYRDGNYGGGHHNGNYNNNGHYDNGPRHHDNGGHGGRHEGGRYRQQSAAGAVGEAVRRSRGNGEGRNRFSGGQPQQGAAVIQSSPAPAAIVRSAPQQRAERPAPQVRPAEQVRSERVRQGVFNAIRKQND